MDKSTSLKSSDAIPNHYYAFTKNNNPDGKFLIFEIWENKYTDKVAAFERLEFNPKTLDAKQPDRLIPFWQKLASNAGLNDPILTLQGDIGNGSELSYGYKDGRDGIPPNAKTYAIKPRFDENIFLMRLGGAGKSIVYHSPLNSSTLREELTNFNKLLMRFFNGEFYELRTEHSDKSTGWEFCNEVLVDNAKLRKAN